MFRIYFANGRVVVEGEARWSQLAEPVEVARERYWVLREPARTIEVEVGGIVHRLAAPVVPHLVFHYDRVGLPVQAGRLGSPVVYFTVFGFLFPDPPAYRLVHEIFPDGGLLSRLDYIAGAPGAP